VVNKEAFHQLLQDPAHITPDSLASLEELVRLFPFCSLAHTLIAKSHYDQATMLASQKVRKAAAYAVNRNRLKKIITGNWPEAPRPELHPVLRPLPPEFQPEAFTLPPLPPLEVTAPELFAPEETVAAPEAPAREMPAPQPVEAEAEPVAEVPAVAQEPLLIEPPADLLFERLVGTLQPPPPVVYPSPEAEEEEEPEEPPLQLGHLNEDEQPIEEYSRRTKKYHQREIIESFIKSEPRISSLNNAPKETVRAPRPVGEEYPAAGGGE
jgi:hypothetical protein